MAMKKNEVLEVIKNGLGLKTNKEAGEVLDTIDAVIEVLVEALDSSEKVAMGNYIILHKKSMPRREGTCAGKSYVVEAHDEMIVKRSTRLKNYLKEIQE